MKGVNRENLLLSVSRDRERFQSLLQLMHSPRFRGYRSLVVYCSFKKTTEQVAQFLKQNGIEARAYHSEVEEGMKKLVQENFMNDKIRVIVATTAFGMGIDKQNIRSVVHFNLPRTLENYIQEIGRAGRDGKEAWCHMFFDDEDYFLERGFILSNSVSAFHLEALIALV